MARKKAAPQQLDIEQSVTEAANQPDDGTPVAASGADAKAASGSPKKKAVVTLPFSGCRDGELHPVPFVEGDEIEGELAGAMIAAGFAKPIKG